MSYCYIRQKSENPISGIYKIVNNVNGRVYVGRSSDIEARWLEHKKALNKKKHFSKELQNDWDTYGKDSFSFEIVEKCSYIDIKYKELYYIFQFENAYNIISNKEKIIYDITVSLNEIKIKNYNNLKFYYETTTKWGGDSFNWDLSIKYKKKTIVVFIYRRSGDLTKERLDYVNSHKNTTLVYQNLACKDQLVNLNDKLVSKILTALNE